LWSDIEDKKEPEDAYQHAARGPHVKKTKMAAKYNIEISFSLSFSRPIFQFTFKI
jgi:hypothetical protein